MNGVKRIGKVLHLCANLDNEEKKLVLLLLEASIKKQGWPLGKPRKKRLKKGAD